MRAPTTQRPSAAMVVAMTALFVAIGGTAIGLPGQNTVNSGDVQDETLKSKDLRNGQAVSSADVIDDSLVADDLGPGSVGSSEVAADSLTTIDLANDSVFNGEIGNGAVGASEIANDAVGTGEIIDSGINAIDIAPANVDESKLGTIDQVQGNIFDFGDQSAENGQWASGDSTAPCPAGTRVISGGVQLIGESIGGNDELAVSASQRIGNGWVVRMISDTDNVDFAALAYCLN